MPRTARRAIAFAAAFVVCCLPASAQPEPRLLVLAIDAVPYGTVAALTDPARGDDALFQDFHPPRPLISTFPSTTSLAFGGILGPLGVEPSPGYEAKFYDRERDEIRGGGLVSYGKIRFPWRDFWDWQLKGLWKKLWGGAWPERKARQLIAPSLAAFAASDRDLYFVYYTTTDLVSHLQGPDGLAPFFVELDAELRALRRRSRRPFHVVLLSDHGMAGGEPLANARRGVLKALRDAGFQRARSLRRDDDVVLVPFGLVSSVAAFTRAGRESAAAAAMARAEGIGVCAAAPEQTDSGGRRVEVYDRHGRAEILVDGDRYQYRMVDSDPLQLAEVVAEHGATLPDHTWLDATAGRQLPDPLYRIVHGFELVRNPASVLCGCAPGYLFGGAPAYVGARVTKGKLHWTHGALDRAASNGFVTTDLPGWDPPDRPLRFDEILPSLLTAE